MRASPRPSLGQHDLGTRGLAAIFLNVRSTPQDRKVVGRCSHERNCAGRVRTNPCWMPVLIEVESIKAPFFRDLHCMAVNDVESLKSFIRQRARETWSERSTPYYLSFVAIDLKKQGDDYRKIITPLKLSQWASSNEIDDTILVKHPTQPARIGFVPADSGFKFEPEDTSEVLKAKHQSNTGRGRALIQFVQHLSNLPDAAVTDFSVPVKTLIALLKQ